MEAHLRYVITQYEAQHLTLEQAVRELEQLGYSRPAAYADLNTARSIGPHEIIMTELNIRFGTGEVN